MTRPYLARAPGTSAPPVGRQLGTAAGGEVLSLLTAEVTWTLPPASPPPIIYSASLELPNPVVYFVAATITRSTQYAVAPGPIVYPADERIWMFADVSIVVEEHDRRDPPRFWGSRSLGQHWLPDATSTLSRTLVGPASVYIGYYAKIIDLAPLEGALRPSYIVAIEGGPE